MATLILNGKMAQLPAVREAVFAQRAKGVSLEVRVTWEAGDAEHLAERAGCREGGRVIAGGGDGTINEVVNGLMRLPPEARPTLGLMPLGSANDLATALALPLAPAAALVVALEQAARPVDVPSLNGRHFLNMATGGFGAEVTSSTPKSLKRLLGGGAYSLIGVLKAWHYRSYPGRLRWAGGEREASLFVLALGNGTRSGGGQRLTPNAMIDDGLLDVLLVRDVASLREMWTMRRELQQRLDEGTHVDTFRTPWLRFEGADELPLTLDGEPCRCRGFAVEVAPGALGLAAPGDCPLLGANRTGPTADRIMSQESGTGSADGPALRRV